MFSSFKFAGLVHSTSHKSQSSSRSNPIYQLTNHCSTSLSDSGCCFLKCCHRLHQQEFRHRKFQTIISFESQSPYSKKIWKWIKEMKQYFLPSLLLCFQLCLDSASRSRTRGPLYLHVRRPASCFSEIFGRKQCLGH